MQNTVFVPQDIHVGYVSKYFHDFIYQNEAMSSISFLPLIALVWSCLAIYFHLSIHPINLFLKNLNWQSSQDIHHVCHEYLSEFTVDTWGHNPGFQPNLGYFTEPMLTNDMQNIFHKSKEMIPCRFARGIQWTKN